MVLHLADQSLNGFSAPNLQATPQRAQMAAIIESWITRLEFGENFYSGLIRMLFQPLKHLSPVSCAALRTRTSARLAAEAAVYGSRDHDTARTRILSPLFQQLCQTIYVLRMKSAGELDTQLVEQLRGSDIRETFEAAAHQWPDHCEGVVDGLAGFGVDQLRSFRGRLG
jgi:hypothetical protein